MEQETKLRVAAVGAGNIVTTRHLPTIVSSDSAELVGVIDRTATKAELFAKKFGAANWGTSLDVDWLSAVDALVIGTSPDVHAQLAVEAFKLGKHVMLEKPMALTVADGEAIVAASQAAKKTLAIVHNFQFASSVQRLKRLVKEGEIGSVNSILCYQCSTQDRRLPKWHEELPLGLFYDESPHLLYLLKSFAGDELEVRDVAIFPGSGGRKTPKVITVNCIGNGIPAVIYNNFEAAVSEWHFVVYGSRKTAIVDIFRDILVLLPHDGQHLALEVMRTSAAATFDHWFGIIRSGIKRLRGELYYGNDVVFRRFVEAVKTATNPEAISGADGLTILKLQHQVLDKARYL